jgi:hypothetical protein
MVTTTMVAMVTNEIGLRDGRLPQARGEGAEVVAVGHSRQAGEDVPHIGHRVFAVTLARDDQRVEDRRALAGVGVPDKQPVLLSDARGPDRIFDQVIVEATFAMMEMGAERSPLAPTDDRPVRNCTSTEAAVRGNVSSVNPTCGPGLRLRRSCTHVTNVA